MIFRYGPTGQRIVRQANSGDINFDVVGDEAVQNETIPVIGKWFDYTGSDVSIDSMAQQLWGGHGNTLQGTDAELQGARLSQLGTVGQRVGTTRQTKEN